MQERLGRFSCDLYQNLEKDQNIFFSGYSISSAMSLAYLGAVGETKRQMAEAMGYVPEAPEVVQALLDLSAALNTSDGKIQTLVGNAVWVQDGLNLTEEFLKIAYNVSELIRKVDYQNSAEGARQEINKWVAEKTKDMITNLIPEKTLSQYTRLVLTNAIYFNGKWSQQFDPELTRSAPFYNLDGTTSDVDLMFQSKAKCRYHEDALYQFVAIPYGDGQSNPAVELFVVLPKEDHFSSVDKLVTYSQLKNMSVNARSRDVRLWMPKFKLRYKNDIASILESNMPLPFSSEADFSGLTGTKDLYISNIIHEAVVDVTEEGTEAAAATAVVMRSLCAMPDRTIVVKVDRPFIFAIWGNGTPMFMGRAVKL